MENASKALIIAGAILLSILIIGLGMFIYQQAAGAFGNTGIDETKIQAYNSKFENYDGIISGANARQLCSVIIQHNLTGAEDFSEFVNVIATDATEVTENTAKEETTVTKFNAAIVTFRNTIKAGKNYKVTFGKSPETGYIVSVGISEVKDAT